MSLSMNSAPAACLAGFGMLLLAQGCAQQVAVSETQGVQFRQSAVTAPADLQLVCAEEAAEIYDVAAARVLPVASSAGGDDTFTVVVNADGTHAICSIDSEGNVLSLVDA